MNLKLKVESDLKISVPVEKGTTPVVVKRKLIICERPHEVQLGETVENEVINEYIGTILYIPDNPFLDSYHLYVSIDNILFFVDSLKLFFNETKGTFKIVSQKRYDDFIDRLLTGDLKFVYNNGVYTYKTHN